MDRRLSSDDGDGAQILDMSGSSLLKLNTTRLASAFTIESLIADRSNGASEHCPPTPVTPTSVRSLSPATPPPIPPAALARGKSDQDSKENERVPNTDLSNHVASVNWSNFPLYNPWLHGYFVQNHDRFAQLLTSSNSFNASLEQDQPLGGFNQHLQQHQQNYQDKMVLSGFGLGIVNVAHTGAFSLQMLGKEDRLASSRLTPTTSYSNKTPATVREAQDSNSSMNDLSRTMAATQDSPDTGGFSTVLRDASLLTCDPPREGQRWIQQNSLVAQSADACSQFRQQFYGIQPFQRHVLPFYGSRDNVLKDREGSTQGTGNESLESDGRNVLSDGDSSCSDISLTISPEESQMEESKNQEGK